MRPRATVVGRDVARQDGFIPYRKLGDGKPKRLTIAPTVQHRIAGLDEAKSIDRGIQMDNIERASRLKTRDAPWIARMMMLTMPAGICGPLRAVATVRSALEPVIVAKGLGGQEKEPDIGPSKGYLDHDLAHKAKTEGVRGTMPAEDSGFGGYA